MIQQPEPTTTRWGRAHAWWQQVPEMDLDRWGVLTTLALYADQDGLCYPSQATIARALKRSRPWVNRVIADLAEAGLIQKTARTRSSNGGTTSCEYRLVMDPNELADGKSRVTGGTLPSHDDDTPRHPSDRTQSELKQNNLSRSAARDPDAKHPKTSQAEPTRELVPPDWTPSADAMAKARDLSPDEDLAAHAVMFASRSRSKGYLYARDRVDDAWLAWLAEDRLNDHRKRRGGDDDRGRINFDSRRDPGDRRFAAWAAAAAVPNARATPPAPTRREADNPWR